MVNEAVKTYENNTWSISGNHAAVADMSMDGVIYYVPCEFARATDRSGYAVVAKDIPKSDNAFKKSSYPQITSEAIFFNGTGAKGDEVMLSMIGRATGAINSNDIRATRTVVYSEHSNLKIQVIFPKAREYAIIHKGKVEVVNY
jgi:hypothetical protein